MQQVAWMVRALALCTGLGFLMTPISGCKGKGDAYIYDDTGSDRSRRGEPDLMYGKVVDRNDKPLSRVTITITPGQVERISSKWGEYEIEYLFSEDGERQALKKNQDYTISAWKAGFHDSTQIFRFSGGSSEIPPITLVEDTITLTPENILDPTTINPDNVVDGDGQGRSFEN